MFHFSNTYAIIIIYIDFSTKGVFTMGQDAREVTIFSFEAQPDMVISRDIFNTDGRMIVPAGTKLDYQTIEKIRNYHILELYVYEALEEDEVSAAPSRYFEAIRESAEFKEFQKNYLDAVADIKTHLSDFVNKNITSVDVDKLTKSPVDMLNGSRSLIHVFDMLHSMRNFDDASYTHCINVALISSIIGKWMNYPDEDIVQLTLAGLMHDIGKLIIPDQILNKPGRLTEGEYAIMKTHSVLGYKKLKDIPISPAVKEACLLHHERYDGSGYPFGLKGDEIPDFAKIVAIADVYDAMTAARVYRGSMCPFQVIATMEKDAFSKYDPRFIIPFLHNVVSSYLHNDVRLSDGREGEVILINDTALSRPIVKCGDEFVDLSKNMSLEIVSIV